MMDVIDNKNLTEQIQASMKKKTKEIFELLKLEVKRIEKDTNIMLYQACLQSNLLFNQEQFNKWYNQVFFIPFVKKCNDILTLELNGVINFCTFLKDNQVEQYVKEFIEEQDKRKKEKVSFKKNYQILIEQIAQLTQSQKTTYLDVFEKKLEQAISNFEVLVNQHRKNVIQYYQNLLKSVQLQTAVVDKKPPEYYLTTLYHRLIAKQIEQLICQNISMKLTDTKIKLNREARDMNREIITHITKGNGNFESEIRRDLIAPLEHVLVDCAGVLSQSLNAITMEFISYVEGSAKLPKATRIHQIEQLLMQYQKIDISAYRVDTQPYYEQFMQSIKKSSSYFQVKGSHNLLFRIASRKKLLLDTALQKFLEENIEHQKELLLDFINIGMNIEEQIKKSGFSGYEQLEQLLEYYENHPENIIKIVEKRSV